MSTIPDTLGWLFSFQKLFSLFNLKFKNQNPFKKAFLLVLNRIPLFVFNIQASFDVYATLSFAVFNMGFDNSRTAFVTSILNIFFSKISFIFLTIYLAIHRKNHLKLIQAGLGFESKVSLVFGKDFSTKRKHLRKWFNFQSIFIPVYKSICSYMLLNVVNDVMPVDWLTILWYGFVICQQSTLDLTAYYIMGYINLFMHSLESFDVINLSGELQIKTLDVIEDFIRHIRQINSLFAICFMDELGYKMLEACSIFFYLFIIFSDLPIHIMQYLKLFLICCFLWIFGAIYTIFRIAHTGEKYQDNMNNLFRNLTLCYKESDQRKGSRDCVDMNIKYFLLRHLHEPNRISLGRDIHVNLNMLYVVITVLVSNIMILIQFKLFEDFQRMEATTFNVKVPT
uniref:Gustatory receptor n=1 Tax=Lutzomyia longipalpis TaxID=7200 RepID=A0A3F2ZD83_LUTLO